MFVYNLKIDKSKFIKIFTVVIISLAIIIFGMSIIEIVKSEKNISESENESDSALNKTSNTVVQNEFQSTLENNSPMEINSENYVNFLKDSHENIKKYIGKEISISGFVYRMPDFQENEIIIARTMIISSEETNNAVIVGILANSDDFKNYKNNAWINCTGTIKKGTYSEKGELPILQVKSISKIDEPQNGFVYEN